MKKLLFSLIISLGLFIGTSVFACDNAQHFGYTEAQVNSLGTLYPIPDVDGVTCGFGQYYKIQLFVQATNSLVDTYGFHGCTNTIDMDDIASGVADGCYFVVLNTNGTPYYLNFERSGGVNIYGAYINTFSLDYYNFSDNPLVVASTSPITTANPASNQAYFHCSTSTAPATTILYQNHATPMTVSWGEAIAQTNENPNGCQFSDLPGHEAEITYYMSVPLSIGTNTICYQEAKNFDEDNQTWDWVGSPICQTTTINYSIPSGTGSYSTSSISNIIGGVDAHSLACSDTDWASSDWWTQLRCNTFYGLLYIPMGFINWINGVMGTLAGILSNMFPFNLPIKFWQSWQDSETGNLPASLAWLETNDGNLYIITPSEWASSTILVFGAGISDGNTAMDNLFNGIRALSTYLMWGGFIYGLWKFGQDIYYELTHIGIEKNSEELTYGPAQDSDPYYWT